MEENSNEKKEEKISDILNSGIVKIENNINSLAKAIGIMGGGIVIFIIICILQEKDFIEKDTYNVLKLILIITEVLTGIYIYIIKYFINIKYKENIMPTIVENIMGDCLYNLDKFIEIDLYYQSGLFEKKDRTVYKGSDYIEYERDKINTVASKLKVKYITGSGKSTSRHTQFIGEYFINRFEKNFEDEKLIIEYNTKLSILYKITEFLFLNIALITISALLLLFAIMCKVEIIASILMLIVIFFVNFTKYTEISNLDKLRKHGEKYGKEFSKMFLIRGSDVLVNKILTKDLKNILIEFYKNSGVKTSISIKNNITYIAFDPGRELFNSGLFDDNKEKYEKDYYLMKEIRKVNDFIADKVLTALE